MWYSFARFNLPDKDAMSSVSALRIRWFAVIFALLTILAGCSSQSSPTQIPPVDQFTIPAVGTLMPPGREEAVKPDLPSDSSGVLVINHAEVEVKVVVSNTLATIPAGNMFLFVLPPDTYQFFVYQPNAAPQLFVEQTQGGKMRYVYLNYQFPAR